MKQSGAASLPSEEEWDFRNFREDQLQWAVFYEYARSSPKVVSVFEKWHEQPLNVPETPPTWHNLTVEQAMKRAAIEQMVPEEVSDAIITAQPPEMSKDPFQALLLIGIRFPQPFCKIGEINTDLLAAFSFIEPQPSPPFSEVRAPDNQLLRYWVGNDPKVIKDRESRGIVRYTIEIDHRFARTRIRAAFEDWLGKTKVGNIPKIPQPRGKAASPPWNELKELAAFRLEASGLKYQHAKRLLEDRLSKIGRRKIVVNHVWPIYKSHGGWHDAVKAAEERLSRPLMELLV